MPCECVDKPVNVSTVIQRYEALVTAAAGSEKRSVTQPTHVLIITSDLETEGSSNSRQETKS